MIQIVCSLLKTYCFCKKENEEAEWKKLRQKQKR